MLEVSVVAAVLTVAAAGLPLVPGIHYVWSGIHAEQAGSEALMTSVAMREKRFLALEVKGFVETMFYKPQVSDVTIVSEFQIAKVKRSY